MIKERLFRLSVLLLLGAAAGGAGAQVQAPRPELAAALEQAIGGPHRDPANTARDRYRHPGRTLAFFGLRPDMRVLEILPGGGWYTEILAPLLREHGKLTVASFGSDYSNRALARVHDRYVLKMASAPDIYDRVRVINFQRPGYLKEMPDAETDMVVTFRNTHNWIHYGRVERKVYQEFYRVLRPGGILGVVQHRAAPGSEVRESASQGYVTEAYLVGIAEQAGFQLLERAEFNANPRDTRRHPEGVWTLPPTLRLQDQDRDQYLAIGESDRMTLKFLKPPG